MSGQIGAIDELAVILVLLADDHTRLRLSPMAEQWPAARDYQHHQEGDAAHDLTEATIRIACGDGYDPEDLVHPEGVEALALYMYCVATDTWERDIPHLPEVNGRALNVPGTRRAWRWRRILTKAVSIISARKQPTMTITDHQIHELSADASLVDDVELVQICSIALAHPGDGEDWIGPDGKPLTRTEARAKCARVIAEAKGNDDADR